MVTTPEYVGADVKPRSISQSINRGMENRHFFTDPWKTKVDQNCYNELLEQSTWRTVTRTCRHRAPKRRSQFLRENGRDFIAADDWASYSPDLILSATVFGIRYPIGFGVGYAYEGRQFPFANLQDLKDAITTKWKEVSIDSSKENPLHNGKDVECS